MKKENTEQHKYIRIFSKKAGKEINVNTEPDISEEKQLSKIIGLSNAVATG